MNIATRINDIIALARQEAAPTAPSSAAPAPAVLLVARTGEHEASSPPPRRGEDAAPAEAPKHHDPCSSNPS